MHNPTNEVSQGSNAPERPLTPSQHRSIIRDKLMDWMDSNSINFAQAGDICGVSTHIIVSVSDRVAINPILLRKISDKVPGLGE